MMFAEFLDFIQAGGDPAPKASPTTLPAHPPSALIGTPTSRIDGPLKTTGTAKYAADYNFPHTAYAMPVCATIGNGKVQRVDTSAAAKMPGVLLMYDHTNVPRTFRSGAGGRNSEGRPPLSDAEIGYWGQYVALAVAETFEQASAAAAAVRVDYEPAKVNVNPRLEDEMPAIGAPNGPKVLNHRGDFEPAFAAAPVKVDATYVTPVETHNPMEMHATTAVWTNDKVTLYESSQGVVNHRHVMAQVLGVPDEHVEVITRFLGSGFGGKLFPWPHCALAAVAARQLNRPVKLMVTRKMMFSNVGHRPRTQQRLRIGASPDGKLLALAHDYRNHTNLLDDIRENCGEATPFLYSTENLRVSSALVRRNTGTPTPMRGPGAVPGLFALESAMDELAIALRMDPVELRLGLDTLTDEDKKKPFTSRHLKECLQVGSNKFGWARRTPAVGSMRRGDLVLGWGVACASWGAGRGVSQATCELRADGSVRIGSATQDVGTGTYTILAQTVTDQTGVPLDRVDVVLGDTSLPPGPMSGGSTATATVLPSVFDAINAAVKNLLQVATQTKGSPFLGKQPEDLALREGRVYLKDKGPASGLACERLLQMANLQSARGEGKSGGLGSDTRAADYSAHSFGAQFVEVEYDPGIAHLRVSRVVTVIDAGKIINPKAGANQIAGAVMMGIGMGLLEETIYDPRNGHPVNDNFADYIVTTHADAPTIDVHFLDIPDPLMGQYGARGIGEIGLAGVAPAITAAVYHATGIRVRELPVRVEDLLPSTVV